VVVSAADLCGCRSEEQRAEMQMQWHHMVFRCDRSVLIEPGHAGGELLGSDFCVNVV
jgi:hypothetical protein